MKFGRKVLEGYLGLAIGILTIVAFIILAGIGTNIDTEFIFLDILIILLIGVNILIAIIQLRMLEAVESFGADKDENDEDDGE
jgi:hypothetical protein